ncbi:MAG: hypothetical protein HY329_01355 [Chloroflexi bacterium]|nr:hypothetical protein [Chloroflexota bacterium]
MPTEYFAWVDRTAEAFEGAFRESRLELATFRLLGFGIGDALVTLNLGVYVEDLAAFNPKNPWLQEQASALASEQERIGSRLAQVQGVPLLDDGQQALTELVAVFSGAPRIGSVADHRSAAATLQDLLRECSELRGRVEESLRGAGSEEL